jgi:hypothetical protein
MVNIVRLQIRQNNLSPMWPSLGLSDSVFLVEVVPIQAGHMGTSLLVFSRRKLLKNAVQCRFPLFWFDVRIEGGKLYRQISSVEAGSPLKFKGRTTMRVTVIVALIISVLVNVSSAQDKTPFEGTWKLDSAKGDSGSEQPLMTMTATISRVAPNSLSICLDGVDPTGKSFSSSWVGAEDGIMHSFDNGSGRQSVRREGNVLIRHGETPDGSTFEARESLSADGNTITGEMIIKSKDGKEEKSHSVWHRVLSTKNQEKPAA